jgi:RNA polymerase-binding transcription factor DksA
MHADREAELNDLVEELRAERAHWLGELEKHQSLAHALSEHLAEPEDVVAIGAAQRDADELEPILERAARRVDAIQRALERAVQGRLSVCDSCGRPIALERLRALPETTLCVDCARARELHPVGER